MYCLPTNQAFLTKHTWLENGRVNNVCTVITGSNLFSGAYMCKRWARVQTVPVVPGRMVVGQHLASVNTAYDDSKYMDEKHVSFY